MIDWVMYDAADIYHSTSFDLDNMGVQAEGKLDFTQLFTKDVYLRSLSVGYTYIHQKRHDSTPIYKSNYALAYLRHKATLSLQHKIYARLSATWSLRWQDRMGEYIDYPSGVLTSYSPYTTLDLKLQWTDRHWQAYVQTTNLTNRRYYDLGNVAQPGVWVLAGARFNINLK
jgi:iron complex outermembrane receptor protein